MDDNFTPLLTSYTKANTGQDIPEDEQALNVIRVLPKTKFWKNFSQVMAHNDNIKTFDAISKHLEMKDERQKSLAPPFVALAVRESEPKGKKAFLWQTCQERSVCRSKLPTSKGIAKKQKAKSNGEKSVARMKCYNYGRKGHYAWDCPEPNKVPLPTKLLM